MIEDVNLVKSFSLLDQHAAWFVIVAEVTPKTMVDGRTGYGGGTIGKLYPKAL